ncbi:MAG: hypothetical protein U0998_11095 [Moraxellaceae bacterium]|nr:hypothetical protein [Moraxellaceae bacterium]
MSNSQLQTKWPILLSHPWSNTAESSFLGDTLDESGDFELYGIKNALELKGATVYQPDKVMYGSNENRGKLLYKRCSGDSLLERLCEQGDGEVIDGVHLAVKNYCEVTEKRQKLNFESIEACKKGLKFNVICHSQGCLDSRYMMAAITNEYSGEPMFKHVVSWTSLAGANKGTALADWVLDRLAICLTETCKSLILDLALGVNSFSANKSLILAGTESIQALSRHYILESTDMSCEPGRGRDCPPSFNQRYPLVNDPNNPILYRSYSIQIDDVTHPCFLAVRPFWEIVKHYEGVNDGYISVDSQQFTTYGAGTTGGVTPVIARHLSGISTKASKPHPGLDHMAFSSSKAPGLPNVSCLGEDNSHLSFSRVMFFSELVAELVRDGY